MRWLLLINLLAVVLLSGAVAIVLEGTPVNLIQTAKVSDEDQIADEGEVLATIPIVQAEVEGQELKSEELAVTEPNAPVPLPAPRKLVAEDTPAMLENVKPRRLRVATEGDFAPFNFLDKQGQPTGFDVDMAGELCRRLEMTCLFETRTWEDLQPSLRRGEVDLLAASMRIPLERSAGVVFSDPYYGLRGRFVMARSAGLSEPGALQSFGAQVAVQEGSLHEAYLKATYGEIELLPTKTLGDALRQVADGRVEAAFGDNAAILKWVKETNCCTVLGSPVTDTRFFGEGIGFVLRDDDPALIEALNRALREMREDGTSAALAERYFGGSIY